MKTGRPLSTPHRSCCTTGDMLVENALRNLELAFSRNGIIRSIKLRDAVKSLRQFISEIEDSISTETPAGVAIWALVRHSCVARLEAAADFAAKAASGKMDIAMEELRYVAAPQEPAFSSDNYTITKGEQQ